MQKSSANQADAQLVSQLGLEVAAFMHDHRIQTTTVRRDSHFGDQKFTNFKKAI